MDGVDALVVLLALVVAAGAGWPVVAGVLRLASRSGDAGSADPTTAVPAVGESAAGDSAADGPGPGDPAASTAALPAPGVATATAQPRAAASSDGPEGPRAMAVLRGGTWIGILERLAVAGSVLLGVPEGVAVVVAVKGLGRYPELRENPGASERFVIGTLASLVWSVAVAAAARALLS
ncbi:hypothetical protein [Cellulomonas sp.]|uniref:hypothetical protein n=1 Tax=Cellulomonas sp. TaxID=40001 RepID=UPI00258D0847|nr:hypothetical protein [Cellulomonas sp.]MCR6689936.1 hypothetical protein [Cellulomonas sp.]